MYTILLQRNDQNWTDYLGSGENSWSTEAEARAAIEELQSTGFTSDETRWKIIPTESLGNYSLVA
jgi:hypothetical protein